MVFAWKFNVSFESHWMWMTQCDRILWKWNYSQTVHDDDASVAHFMRPKKSVDLWKCAKSVCAKAKSSFRVQQQILCGHCDTQRAHLPCWHTFILMDWWKHVRLCYAACDALCRPREIPIDGSHLSSRDTNDVYSDACIFLANFGEFCYCIMNWYAVH